MSFAFPLREEKEFNSESLIDDPLDQNTKETERDADQSFTSIKVTPTVSLYMKTIFLKALAPTLFAR